MRSQQQSLLETKREITAIAGDPVLNAATRSARWDPSQITQVFVFRSGSELVPRPASDG